MLFRLERSAMEESFLFVLLFKVPTRGYIPPLALLGRNDIRGAFPPFPEPFGA